MLAERINKEIVTMTKSIKSMTKRLERMEMSGCSDDEMFPLCEAIHQKVIYKSELITYLNQN